MTEVHTYFKTTLVTVLQEISKDPEGIFSISKQLLLRFYIALAEYRDIQEKFQNNSCYGSTM